MSLLSRVNTAPIRISDGDSSLSGRRLQDRCNQMAGFLTGLDVERIALLADNSIDWLCVDLACQQSNICLVPLPLYFSDAQIQHVLTTCAIQAVISHSDKRLLQVTGGDVNGIPGLPADSLKLWVLPASEFAAQIPSGTTKITFTSGSTGQPKGVCLSTTHLLEQAQRLCEAVALERPRHLCLLPLATLLENVAGVYAPILAGGQVIVPGLETLGFAGSALQHPQKMLQVISAQQPDSLIVTPQLLTLLVSATQQGWQVPESLEFVAVGGARVASAAILAARANGLPVYEGYGLSESASVVTLNTPEHDLPGSCGKVLQGLSVSIDRDEIIVHDSVMLGYVNDPGSWGKASFATGDIGQIDSKGFLRIEGRKRNVLISSYGRNISPEWVESELLANPLISEAIVMGDARPYCTALLSVHPSVNGDEAIEHWLDCVNAKLPDYAQVKKWSRLSAPLRGDSRFMTPNGRPLRRNIDDAFQDEINSLYQDRFLRDTQTTQPELQVL